MNTDHTWPASDPTHGYGSPAPLPLRSKSAAAAGTAVLSPVTAKGKSAELLGPHMSGVRSSAAKKAIAQRRKLYACLALLVISGAGVQIYMRRALAALHNYSYFVFQSGAIAYFPIVLAVTLFKFMFTKDITSDMVRASLVPKFLLMALLDSCEDFAVITGTAHTTVALQTLLPQGVLPVTMLFSLLWLKVSYSSKHYAAAVCIMAGVVVVVLPSFSRHVVTAAVGFEVLLFCGNVPGALSSLYKQASLQYRRVDVFYLSTWITFFQIIIGFAMTPVNTLLPPAEGGVALQDVGTQFSKGAMCLLGQNSVVCNLDSCAFYKQVVQNGTSLIQKFNTTAGTRPLDIATCYQYDPLLANNGNPHNGLPQCDACEDALWIWAMFIFFVFVNNVLLLKVVKYGSAAFMYAANAVTLPLVNVLGTSPMVMGPGQAAPLNPFTIVGMGFMLVGLAMWAFGVRQQERRDEQFASGRAYMAGQPRVAFGVPLLPAPSTTAAGAAATLARDPMTVRKQLYSKLGVSSPGPGRVVSRTPLLSPLPPARSGPRSSADDAHRLRQMNDFGMGAFSDDGSHDSITGSETMSDLLARLGGDSYGAGSLPGPSYHAPARGSASLRLGMSAGDGV